MNVAAGTQSSDAVNLSPLGSVVGALGGGVVINKNGTITAPSYSVGGTTVDNVGDALSNIDDRTTQNTADFAGNTSAIGGLDTRVGATEDSIAKNTSDIAMNVSTISNIDGRVSSVEGSVTNLTQQLSSGEVGLVKQDAGTQAITVASETGGKSMDIMGTEGARTLSGVKDGKLADGSTEAGERLATGSY
ncbi:hypothetical protein [Paraburkholderia sp. 31.1]|uniref:hypothetical protein n=1 Tax=Paraburkholderia sp. 31.1 TaxID=2615205 RepID=UPI001656402F|nr:hypothetical protein [Paraburkholderia sp. 31.1]